VDNHGEYVNVTLLTNTSFGNLFLEKTSRRGSQHRFESFLSVIAVSSHLESVDSVHMLQFPVYNPDLVAGVSRDMMHILTAEMIVDAADTAAKADRVRFAAVVEGVMAMRGEAEEMRTTNQRLQAQIARQERALEAKDAEHEKILQRKEKTFRAQVERGDALFKSKQELEQRLAEAEGAVTAVPRRIEELEAAVSQLAQEAKEAEREREAALAATRSSYTRAIDEIKATHKEALEAQARAHRAALESAQAEATAKHEFKAKELEVRREAQAKELEARAKELEAKREAHAKKLEAKREAQARELEARARELEARARELEARELEAARVRDSPPAPAAGPGALHHEISRQRAVIRDLSMQLATIGSITSRGITLNGTDIASMVQQIQHVEFLQLELDAKHREIDMLRQQMGSLHVASPGGGVMYMAPQAASCQPVYAYPQPVYVGTQ
jgi:DNA repair exonuclease SbcCD ATPase subunit